MKVSTLRLLTDARSAKAGSEQAMAARRQARLAELVAWARTRSPYYRHLYRGLPARVNDVAPLPPTTKSELMAAFDDWVTDPAVTLAQARACADACPCGNPGPAVRVQGRAADLLTFPRPGPAGEQAPVILAPLPLATLLEAVPGLDLFQIVQTAPTALRIRLHPAPGANPDALWRQVETRMRDLLARHGLSHVAIERASAPPQQNAGGKYRAVIPAAAPSSKPAVDIP